MSPSLLLTINSIEYKAQHSNGNFGSDGSCTTQQQFIKRLGEAFIALCSLPGLIPETQPFLTWDRMFSISLKDFSWWSFRSTSSHLFTKSSILFSMTWGSGVGKLFVSPQS